MGNGRDAAVSTHPAQERAVADAGCAEKNVLAVREVIG